MIRVNDYNSKGPSLQSGLVVNKFSEVFLDDLPGVPQDREIDFSIELVPDTRPISIPPYGLF